MALVSVIIPTFNRSFKLERAVNSVLTQGFKDLELIVVDDGSTDDTEKVLERYNHCLEYIKHPFNKGVSAARNTGIGCARSPWVAFLDSDDYWLKDKLTAQLEMIENIPDMVACQTEEIWIRGGVRVNPRKKHKKTSGNIFVQSLKMCMITPSSVIIRKRVLDKIGLFDDTFPAAEDYELWLRLSSRFPVYLVDKLLVVKEGGHKDQLSRSFSGMDLLRIKAIIKLLASGTLSKKQARSAIAELSCKCAVYGKGCIKRGRHEEGNFYLSLPERLSQKPP